MGDKPNPFQGAVNQYLFESPNASYLEVYQYGIEIQAENGPVFNVTTDVKFGFHSRRHPKRQIFNYETRDAINSSVIDSSKPLRVIIHGWQNSADTPVIHPIIDAYLDRFDVNVMIVDWKMMAKETYLIAREVIDLLGR